MSRHEPASPGAPEPPFVRAPELAGVRHAFFGRSGGVSTGIYAGLNVGLGSNDAPEAVAENRARALAALAVGYDGPPPVLVTVHQVHGSEVVLVDGPVPHEARPRADAMVTARPGLALGILAADCAPVLLADERARVIGAAHAGWRPALGGVLQRTVSAMAALGAEPGRIVAAVGPCIARRSYEVDEAFMERFLAADPGNERFFAPGRPGRYQFDLEGYAGAALAQAGVGRVGLLGLDTYSDPERFFSYRRSFHAAEGDYGRQLSVIML
jgi:YfiH family protein